MVKLRDDLTEVVYLNGQPYAAGDEIPEGVRVGGHLTEDGREHGSPAPVVPAPNADAVEAGPAVEPLTEEETAKAEEIGLPTDIHPERTRGALLGYEQGVTDSLARAARGTAFDPGEAPNADAVEAYLTAHPEEAVAVLALEAAGKARKGILSEYL